MLNPFPYSSYSNRFKEPIHVYRRCHQRHAVIILSVMRNLVPCCVWIQPQITTPVIADQVECATFVIIFSLAMINPLPWLHFLKRWKFSLVLMLPFLVNPRLNWETANFCTLVNHPISVHTGKWVVCRVTKERSCWVERQASAVGQI